MFPFRSETSHESSLVSASAREGASFDVEPSPFESKTSEEASVGARCSEVVPGRLARGERLLLHSDGDILFIRHEHLARG